MLFVRPHVGGIEGGGGRKKREAGSRFSLVIFLIFLVHFGLVCFALFVCLFDWERGGWVDGLWIAPKMPIVGEVHVGEGCGIGTVLRVMPSWSLPTPPSSLSLPSLLLLLLSS